MHRVDEFRKLFYRNRVVVERGDCEGMWSTVTPCDADSPAPSARAKHSATLLCGHVYLLGGRNGNVPLKDFWKYNLAEGTWQQLQPSGDRPPCLQEHTAVPYRDSIYVFGGEVGFSAGTETPLWVYDVKQNCWRKVRARKGVQVPRGRRGHTALVHRGTMLVYGGYQDLRGSCTELWAFHFETESWHLISSSGGGGGRSTGDTVPPARHKHSAIMHDDSMFVYGGMTDLQERADLWRWDTVSKTWTGYKLKHTPGPLHSHAACRLPSSMVLFGGERDGHPTNDLWKFHFDTGAWEKLIVNGLRPQARAECVAFAVSELLLKNTSGVTLESRMARTRSRTMHSNNTTSTSTAAKPSSYIPHNRVSPYEKTYVFKPTQGNYTDGSELLSHPDNITSTTESTRSQTGGFLREISKLSQLNLSRLNHTKCSYTVLATGNNDSTESLLRQHSSGVQDTDSESSTPNRMIKSRSAYAIKKKYNEQQREPSSTAAAANGSNSGGVQETCIDSTTLRNTRLTTDTTRRMTRDPISVPNFGALARQAPALTPVEAARLVFLDTDDDDDDDDDEQQQCCKNNIECTGTKVIHVQSYSSPKKCHVYENFKSVKRGESYNSHLGYADNPLYAVKFGKCRELEEVSDETSDYASIETMNRLSSSSSYSYSTTSRQHTPQDTTATVTATAAGESTGGGGGGVAAVFRARGNGNKVQVADGPFGFCNPNYMGPDIQLLLSSSSDNKKQQYAKLLNTPDSVLEDALGRSTSRFFEEHLELQNIVNSEMTRHGRHKSATVVVPPKSLELTDMTPSNKSTKRGKCRASSASRVERHSTSTNNNNNNSNSGTGGGVRRAQVTASVDVPASDVAQSDVYVPLYVFIVGGKEQGQVTVFKRPISIWKLKLF